MLAERAAELGVEIRRGHELIGLSQDGDTVCAEVHYQMESRFLVGADGGRSTVRKLCGIEFPGVTLDGAVSRIAQVSFPDELVDPGNGALLLPGFPPIAPFQFQRTDDGGSLAITTEPNVVCSLTDGFRPALQW